MKKILILATGGTIASVEGGDGLTPGMSGEELLRCVPGLSEHCELKVLQVMNIDSTNMRPEQWLLIADKIQENYESFDGFVVLHGTDTMAYTAAALSYLLQNSRKPIVLTGSQKPMGNPYTDARLNVYQSICYACDDGAHDVSIVFNGKVIAGTRARKQRTRSYDAFESMNYPLLAVMHDDHVVRPYQEMQAGGPAGNTLKTSHVLGDGVFVLKLNPAVRADAIELLAGRYDVIVLESFGIGGIPDYDDSFEQAILSFVDAGKTVVVTTQVPEEGVDLGVYEVGRRYKDHPGILQASDMTTEAIVAKMMWILGQTRDQREIAELFARRINHDRL